MAGLSPKLPIQRDPQDGYALTKTHSEMVLQNLKNILLTVPGERIMDPMFGVGLRTYLFEQQGIGTYSNIYAKTLTQVIRYLPFVQIDDMVFYGPTQAWSAVDGFLDELEDSRPYTDDTRLQIKIFLTIVPLSQQTTLELTP